MGRLRGRLIVIAAIIVIKRFEQARPKTIVIVIVLGDANPQRSRNVRLPDRHLLNHQCLDRFILGHGLEFEGHLRLAQFDHPRGLLVGRSGGHRNGSQIAKRVKVEAVQIVRVRERTSG